jgi:formiminoglutamase
MDSVDIVYLTIDMDGFASSVAPGVSAPSPFGFTPEVVLPALKRIASSGKLMSMDVVEYNPEFDIDHRTARLAARVIAHAIASKP